ncbi:predicted protein [Naegleria gruberi]|uniref:Zinc transporter ZIP11 n=1 Tax=Naegleria gruberi TaxID=5762 RepID=D2VGT5_NAEGR|nr:uncharacterized protein NAEGRDRAFT_79918 [Naegleria gruberi]EFC44118.1 predicted protein [Naegleria gruberi]|eukprot:XP_002676862.1 predicted protein [Naegleria gruberi strain NEG-M]
MIHNRFHHLSQIYSVMDSGLNQTTNGTDTHNMAEFYSFLLTIHPIGLGVIFTTINWLFTTLGAAACFFFICCSGRSNKFYTTVMELLFGLGGGIMLAASFFSLLLPAAELSEKQYGEYISVLPVFGGFTIGILFFIIFDIGVDYLNDFVEKKKKQYDRELQILEEQEAAAVEPIMSSASLTEVTSTTSVIEMKDSNNIEIKIEEKAAEVPPKRKANWKSKLSSLLVKFRRSFLLMLSMTIHNLPEGIVVGVAFGSISNETNKNGISISNAVSLSLGVGIQNIPEGLSVSLPLVRDGAGYWKSFFIGSASALVEILGGLIGSGLVTVSESILPYALSFASACMIFVVVSELIPETISKHDHSSGEESEPKSDLVAATKLEEGTLNSTSQLEIFEKTPDVLVPRKKQKFYKLTSRIGLAGFFVGFIIMMILDLVL